MYKRITTTFWRGFRNSIKTFLKVLKIILPITLLIVLLNQTPYIKYISTLLEPIMSIFGLSGNAALPLFLGMFAGVTDSTAAIIALGLPIREITIVGVMVGLCNSVIAETLIFKKFSRHYWKTAIIRILVAFSTGFLLKFVI